MRYNANEAVITTQSVLEGARITRVFYDADNTGVDWTFTHSDDWTIDDLRLISMEEIIIKDSRLLDIINSISENEAAIYDNKEDEWRIIPYDYSSNY